jgi:hypothetical protein
MTFPNILRLAAALFAAYLSASVSAATVYDATRLDYETRKRDVDVKISVAEGNVRIDVRVAGRTQVTLIESPEHLVLIDHVTGIYAERHLSPEDRKAAPPSTGRLLASRRQIALGGYCTIVEDHWPEAGYQERCLVRADTVLKDGAKSATSAGEFLGLIAAIADREQLFATAAAALASTARDSSFPLVIRHFEAGRARAELRIVAANNDSLPRKTFALPKGLHRVVADQFAARHAAR